MQVHKTILNHIAHCYSYKTSAEMFDSLIPSVKYNSMDISVIAAMIVTFLEIYIGFKGATIIAFLVLATTEFLTGVYASVKVSGEDFESEKLARFSIKFMVLLVTFYCCNSFRKEFQETSAIISSVFNWAFYFGFAFFALEYLVSVLENLAVISGKPKSEFINAIKKKISSL